MRSIWISQQGMYRAERHVNLLYGGTDCPKEETLMLITQGKDKIDITLLSKYIALQYETYPVPRTPNQNWRPCQV
jgi:hypothetical protein